MKTSYYLPALLYIICSFVSTAYAQTKPAWQPELKLSEERSYLLTTDSIRLYIPPEVPVEILQNLALEIDDIDVTSFIKKEGDLVVYTPPSAFAYGKHRIRVVENAQDGSIIEHGMWEVEVRKNAQFREASLAVAGSAVVSQRVGEHNLKKPRPDRTQSAASIGINGVLADNDWRSSLNLPVLYDSALQKKELDIGDFRMDWQQNRVSAVIGHQAVGSDSLIISGFNRRGMSAGYNDQDSGTSVQGFVVRGNAISGITHGLGVGDVDNRIQGASVKFYPVREQGKLLELSGSYLTGKTTEASKTSSGETQSNKGSAWNLAADSLLMDNRLRLRGEYAQTRYDFDGKGGFAPENDKAYTLLATYQPWSQEMIRDNQVSWIYGAEHRYVGTFFRSAASLGAVADREMNRLFTELYLGGLQVSAQWAQEHDNVDNKTGLPRVKTRQALISMGYNPAPEYNEQGLPQLGWLGQQNYVLTLSRQTRKTDKGKTATDFIDTRTLSAQAGASFNYSFWNWGINHNWSRNNDDSLVSGNSTKNDSLNNSTTLTASFIILDNFTISPRITRDVVRMYNWDYSDYTFERGIDFSAVLIPDKLTAQLSYNMNHTWRSYDKEKTATDPQYDKYTEQSVLNLSWQARRATQNRPGLTFSIDASYNTIKDDIDSSGDTMDYQVFFRMRLDGAGIF